MCGGGGYRKKNGVEGRGGGAGQEDRPSKQVNLQNNENVIAQIKV